MLGNLVSLPNLVPADPGGCRWKAIPAGDSFVLHRTHGAPETPASPDVLPPRAALMLGKPFAVNRADVRELDILPGIGVRLAENIVRYRREHGPFTDPAQLVRVPGIGPALTARLTPLLTVAVHE